GRYASEHSDALAGLPLITVDCHAAVQNCTNVLSSRHQNERRMQAMVLDRSMGGGALIEDAGVQALQASLRGRSVLPGDADYDAARTLHNAQIDKCPALIVQCAGV